MLNTNKIYQGDCQKVMLDIDSDSIDCIVTDPPYQLSSLNIKNATKGFMGKSWDICPSVAIWQKLVEEEYRELRPVRKLKVGPGGPVSASILKSNIF